MDKVVWQDENGWHVMVGNTERIEEKRQEILDRQAREDSKVRLLR